MYDQLLANLRDHSAPDAHLDTLDWAHRYLYSFTTGEGCGGPDHAGYWLHDQPISRGDCETIRRHAERTAVDARHATPRTPRPRADTWTGTVGELWAATDAATDDDRATSSAAQSAAQAAELDALHAAGFTQVHLRHVECHDGDNNAHLALEVIVNHGCRCGHGGASYDNDLDDDTAPAGVWVATTSDGRRLVAATATAPDRADVAAALDAARAARDAELDHAARDAAARAAATLSLDEIAELTVDGYRAYLDAIGRRPGTRLDLRPHTAPTPAAPDIARIVAAAQRRFDTTLAAHDLHLETPDTAPGRHAGALDELIATARSVTVSTLRRD
jgi:hypothetical protein